MTTNKQAYNRAIIKELSVNYNTVFRYGGHTGLTTQEYEKLYRYLKPLYTYIDNDKVIFRLVNQIKELQLIK